LAKRITITYLLISALWIVGSDLIFGEYWTESAEHQEQILMSILKGLFFVTVTSSLLFLYLRTQFKTREQKEAQFLQLFEDHPNPMLVCNSQGAIEAVNQAAERLYGHSAANLHLINYSELNLGKDFKEAANGEIQEHVHAEGQIISVRVHFKRTQFYGEASWLIVLIDVAEEQRMRTQNENLHKEVRLKESYLFSLIEAQSTYLIRIDLKGQFLFRNKAFLSLFGNSAGLQQPMFLPELLTSADHKKLNTLLAKCAQSPGKNYAILLQLSLVATLNRITEWEFLAIQDDNGVITEFQGVGRDVTDKLQYLEQLSSYKEQLEGILRTLNDVVWSVDAVTNKIRYLNAASKHIYGRTPEAFYADASLWFEAIVPEDREKVLHHMEKVKLSGSGEIEYRVKHTDGSIRYLRDRSVLVNDDKGKPRTINGIATNITELVTSRADVERMNDQVKTILETMTDAFFTLDETLCFKEVNKSMEKLMGKNRDELRGNTFESSFGGAGIMTYKPIFDASFTTQQVQERQVYDQHLDKWLEISVYPISYGLAVFINDQTDNHRLQEALVKEQQNLAGLINNTTDFIWSVDRNLCLITGNNAFKEIYKLTLGREIEPGEPMFQDNQPPAYAVEWTALYKRALGGEAFICVQNRHYIDRIMYTEISFYPIRDAQGQVSSVGCFGKDITDRTEKEMKIKEQNEQLLEIAWIESHKLRAPLANMMGLIELLNLQETNEDPTELRVKLYSSCQELDTIIHEVVKKANAVSYFSRN